MKMVLRYRKALGVAVIFLAAGGLRGQDTNPPTFEVATVKPDNSNARGEFFDFRGVTVRVTNQTLRGLILFAYRVRDFQLTGGPGWLASNHWDVEAKVPTSASMDDKLQMLQTLLKARFQLAIHREIKDLPIFNMTVAKRGLKIQPIQEGSCIAYDPVRPGPESGKTPMDYCGAGGRGRGMIQDSSATMTEFAQQVSGAVERTVIDKTGVSGRFRIHLTFAPENTSTADLPGPPPATDSPTIYTALEEQLGLHLESSKGPIEVLIIDHAEKPTEN